MGTNDRLDEILEGADSGGKDEGTISEDMYPCVHPSQLKVLKIMNQQDLLMILNYLMKSQKTEELSKLLEEAIEEVGGDIKQQLERVENDQYKTIEIDTKMENSEEKSSVVPEYDLSDGDEEVNTKLSKNLSEQAKCVPLRLAYDERVYLRLLEAALDVSEYTDKVDILINGSKARKIAHEIKQMCAVLSGLVVSNNYEEGQRLLKERDFQMNEEFFKLIFEVGRRYKILNPERMRSAYGKLVYLLMDSARADVEQILSFNCIIPVNTVYKLLEQKNGLNLLTDPRIHIATREVLADGKTRGQIQNEIREKEEAVKLYIYIYQNSLNEY
eukprot:GHVL01013980.1.p1 GENE.GHVL01013980.1~~GHVL01013980.1.p1  ORF type:complete len:329 (-),score=76.71 GHVL01013980.1:37-1023(-)